MSKAKAETTFTDEDYRALEGLVRETERGRWFLDEHAKRNKVAETQGLLDAINKIENNLISRPVVDVSASSTMPELAALAEALETTITDMAAIHNDMLKNRGFAEADEDIFDHVSQSARRIATSMSDCAGTLHDLSSTLTLNELENTDFQKLKQQSEALFEICWQQDVLAQRIARLAGFTCHARERLAAMVPAEAKMGFSVKAQSAAVTDLTSKLTSENLQFFEEDAELFYEGESKSSAKSTEQATPASSDPQAPTITAQTDQPAVDTSGSDEASELAAPEPVKEAATALAQPPADARIVVIRRAKKTGGNEKPADKITEVDQDKPQDPPVLVETKIDVRPPADMKPADTELEAKPADTELKAKSADAEPEAKSVGPDDVSQKPMFGPKAEAAKPDTAAVQQQTPAAQGPQDATKDAGKASNSVSESLLASLTQAAEMAMPAAHKQARAGKTSNAPASVADQFASTPSKSAATPAAGASEGEADKERIKIIRRGASSETMIPFGSETSVS